LAHFARHHPRGPLHFGAGDPAVVIDRVVAHHLEVLRLVRRGGLGALGVEGVHHADTLDRLLRDAIDDLRRLDAGRFQDRRYDVDDVVELVADAALVLDSGRPLDRHPLPHAAEVRRDLLGPGERRVERPGPRHGHVRVGLIAAPGVVELELILYRKVNALDRGDLVRRPDQRAFGAVAVVAGD